MQGLYSGATDAPMFQPISVPGKFVLAGEHAVLRGHPAVALQHPTAQLRLSFQEHSKGLFIEPKELEAPLTKILDRLSVQIPEVKNVKGTLSVENHIPLSAGLGSSAALCVALAQWAWSVGGNTENHSSTELIHVATELENIFHGKSSGMDVAAVVSKGPIRFIKGQTPELVSAFPDPEFRFEFFDTGLRSSTQACIAQVDRWRSENAASAGKVDERMARASELAVQGLTTGKSRFLIESMELSNQCFEDWGLVPAKVRELQRELKEKGALASKITGAGNGGFLVVLFRESH